MFRKFIQVSKNDLSVINSLLRRSKAYWGYDEAFMDKFMQLFQMTTEYLEKNTVKLFCMDDKSDKPVGFYGFRVNIKEPEVDYFFIDPEYLGQGLGKEMWSLLLKDIKIQGVNRFILWSDPGAESFYKKMGCIKIGVKESPLMPNRFPVIFEYNL